MEYVYILREALVWIVTIFWLYQFIISLCSLVKLKERPLKENKEHKFMAIIPAHNEQEVVGNLIESLKNQTYSKDAYDIYVIADNCTDNTAVVARRAGAIDRFYHIYLSGSWLSRGYPLLGQLWENGWSLPYLIRLWIWHLRGKWRWPPLSGDDKGDTAPRIPCDRTRISERIRKPVHQSARTVAAAGSTMAGNAVFTSYQEVAWFVTIWKKE